jgi:hypothetical protein
MSTLQLKTVPTATRTIKRGPNPFAPIAKIQNQNLSNPHTVYDALTARANTIQTHADIVKAIAALKVRLNGQAYQQHHFGRLEEIDESLIDVNVDIQRFLEVAHIGDNIITLFDPRIMQPLNVIYIKETGRYSSWEGQQSGTAFVLMKLAGLIAPGTKIQCKVVDNDLVVPGSTDVGEAVGNYGFRRLGGNGRKGIGAYFTHRSRVNGVRMYGSTLHEDVQSDDIQKVLETNDCYPAASIQGQKKKPGMITYISGVNNIAHHGSEDANIFALGLKDLDWALRWHNTYFPAEDGVDGGFILAFGRFAAEATAAKFKITAKLEADLYRHVITNYGSPAGFHRACKERLTAWQKANKLKTSWSDSCLTPILILDYVACGGKEPVPAVNGMQIYAGI